MVWYLVSRVASSLADGLQRIRHLSLHHRKGGFCGVMALCASPRKETLKASFRGHRRVWSSRSSSMVCWCVHVSDGAEFGERGDRSKTDQRERPLFLYNCMGFNHHLTSTKKSDKLVREFAGFAAVLQLEKIAAIEDRDRGGVCVRQPRGPPAEHSAGVGRETDVVGVATCMSRGGSAGGQLV